MPDPRSFDEIPSPRVLELVERISRLGANFLNPTTLSDVESSFLGLGGTAERFAPFLWHLFDEGILALEFQPVRYLASRPEAAEPGQALRFLEALPDPIADGRGPGPLIPLWELWVDLVTFLVRLHERAPNPLAAAEATLPEQKRVLVALARGLAGARVVPASAALVLERLAADWLNGEDRRRGQVPAVLGGRPRALALGHPGDFECVRRLFGSEEDWVRTLVQLGPRQAWLDRERLARFLSRPEVNPALLDLVKMMGGSLTSTFGSALAVIVKLCAAAARHAPADLLAAAAREEGSPIGTGWGSRWAVEVLRTVAVHRLLEAGEPLPAGLLEHLYVSFPGNGDPAWRDTLWGAIARALPREAAHGLIDGRLAGGRELGSLGLLLAHHWDVDRFDRVCQAEPCESLALAGPQALPALLAAEARAPGRFAQVIMAVLLQLRQARREFDQALDAFIDWTPEGKRLYQWLDEARRQKVLVRWVTQGYVDLDALAACKRETLRAALDALIETRRKNKVNRTTFILLFDKLGAEALEPLAAAVAARAPTDKRLHDQIRKAAARLASSYNPWDEAWRRHAPVPTA